MPYGTDYITFNLPDHLNIQELLPKPIKQLKDPIKKLLNSLDHPIRAQPLKNIIKSKKGSIVIVVDDNTRKFPFQVILPPLLKYIELNSVEPHEIKILVACGTHPAPSQEQISEMFGNSILDYKLLISDIRTSKYVEVGKTKRGSQVFINEEYINADIKILVTDITLHYFAGFGGDRKSIYPGLANKESIEANHKLMFEKGVGPGLLDGNPVHEDMREGAQLAGCDFVINMCLDDEARIYEIVSGGLNDAFRVAVEEYKRYFVIDIQDQADLLIMSQGGHPYDINYYQSQKSLQQCLKCLKTGGMLIYFTKSTEGIGNPVLDEFTKIYSNPDELFEQIKGKFKQGAHNAYFQLKFAQQYKIYLKSDLSKEVVKKQLHFFAIDNIQQLINMLNPKIKKVIIIPHGAKMMINLTK